MSEISLSVLSFFLPFFKYYVYVHTEYYTCVFYYSEIDKNQRWKKIRKEYLRRTRKLLELIFAAEI